MNHNGDKQLAFQLVDAAADAGADFVKFQTFKAAKLATKQAAKASYQTASSPKTKSQQEMLKQLELSHETHFELVKHCQKRGIRFLSAPFDSESAGFLVEELSLKLLKIPSGEITNGPLLLEIASRGTPVILSTGMSNLGDIEMALSVLAHGYLHPGKPPKTGSFQGAYTSKDGQRILKKNVVLLHCTSEYPAPIEDVNLRAMATMSKTFGLKVGYSDHTRGIIIPIAATAMGAAVIEKHFTLDRNFPGPDHKASLEFSELKEMVEGIRAVELARGTGIKSVQPSEALNLHVARKSLVALAPIRKGSSFTIENLGAKRPGHGLSPMEYWSMLGQKAARDYSEDELIG